jgi:hypothetical protein
MNTQDTFTANLLADRFAVLAFCYGSEIPEGKAFVSVAYTDESIKTRTMEYNEQAVDTLGLFVTSLVDECHVTGKVISGLGVMLTGQESYGSYCQDNFMTKCGTVYVPVDNEGEPDIQAVVCPQSDVQGIVELVQGSLDFLVEQRVCFIAG